MSTLDPFGYPISAANPPVTKAKGCDECNREGDEPKPWPIFTVNFHGVESCAKCLTPMAWGRS